MATEYPPSYWMKSLLTTHVASSGWQIEVGVMPENIDKVIGIIDTQGVAPNPKWLRDFPRVQVMVRGKPNSYIETFREAKAVKDILLGIDSQDLEVGGDRLVAINLLNDLGFIGRDDGQRPMFSMNFDLIIEPFASSNTHRAAL